MLGCGCWLILSTSYSYYCKIVVNSINVAHDTGETFEQLISLWELRAVTAVKTKRLTTCSVQCVHMSLRFRPAEDCDCCCHLKHTMAVTLARRMGGNQKHMKESKLIYFRKSFKYFSSMQNIFSIPKVCNAYFNGFMFFSRRIVDIFQWFHVFFSCRYFFIYRYFFYSGIFFIKDVGL